MIISRTLIALFVILGMSLGAQAQEPPAEGSGMSGGSARSVKHLLKRADADGDRNLSLSEWTASVTERAEHLFDRLDRNGDGAVEPAEFRPPGPPHLDAEDLQAIRACVAERVGLDMPAPPEDMPERLAEADLDGSGSLSRDEFATVALARAESSFARMDVDNNGQLAVPELADSLRERAKRDRVMRACSKEIGAAAGLFDPGPH